MQYCMFSFSGQGRLLWNIILECEWHYTCPTIGFLKKIKKRSWRLENKFSSICSWAIPAYASAGWGGWSWSQLGQSQGWHMQTDKHSHSQRTWGTRRIGYWQLMINNRLTADKVSRSQHICQMIVFSQFHRKWLPLTPWSCCLQCGDTWYHRVHYRF